MVHATTQKFMEMFKSTDSVNDVVTLIARQSRSEQMQCLSTKIRNRVLLVNARFALVCLLSAINGLILIGRLRGSGVRAGRVSDGQAPGPRRDRELRGGGSHDRDGVRRQVPGHALHALDHFRDRTPGHSRVLRFQGGLRHLPA